MVSSGDECCDHAGRRFHRRNNSGQRETHSGQRRAPRHRYAEMTYRTNFCVSSFVQIPPFSTLQHVAALSRCVFKSTPSPFAAPDQSKRGSMCISNNVNDSNTWTCAEYGVRGPRAGLGSPASGRTQWGLAAETRQADVATRRGRESRATWHRPTNHCSSGSSRLTK